MSKNTQNPVSNQDVLQAVQAIDHKFTGLFGGLDQKFTGLEGKFTSLDQKLTDHIEESKQIHEDILSAVNAGFTTVTTEIHEIKQDITGIKGRLNNVESQMVTKDYLDDKLHDLRGDLTVVIRKEDRKVVALIDELRQTKVLSEPAAQRILALEPFPQG